MRTAYRLLTTGTVAVASALAFALSARGATDHFLEQSLAAAWIVESPGQAEHIVEDGWLHVEVPGRHWLGMLGFDRADAPMYLVEPPGDAWTVTFDTRLRFLDGPAVPQYAAAGLVLVRRDLTAGVLFQAVRHGRRLGGEWWWDDSAILGPGPPAFRAGEDIWLRFQHRGDRFVLYRKAREDDPWEDVTEDMPDNLSNINHQFPAGEFLVGLFATSGANLGDSVEVEFDYLSSPQLKALDVQAAGKAAIAWGTLKDGAR